MEIEITQGFEDALKNQKLIHGVLKRVHIYPTRFDYEDYFQEALIIYAQTYLKYCQKNQDLEKFKPYVFQKLVWRMTDMLRQEKSYYDFNKLDEFDFKSVPQGVILESLEFINLTELNRLEREILQEHFINGTSLLKIARQEKCTSRNLRYHRDKLLQKLRRMKAE